MNAKQLKELIIIPTLDYIQKDSAAAQNLLLGTAAQESHLGQYLKQINGPAVSIWMIEEETFDDCHRYLRRDENLRLYEKIKNLITVRYYGLSFKDLIGNLPLACALARIKYLMVKEPLPDANNIPGLAKYWKKYYNTALGKGTEEQFIENYKRYVLCN